MITIRHGTLADAAVLAEFAAATFRAAFGHENRPDDMALHLSRSYGVAQQSAELADPTITTLLVEEADRLAGYAQLRPGAPPPCVEGGGTLELWRFYVGQAWHGSGVAQTLMAATVAAASARGARTLWLGVWERNPRAQAFYWPAVGVADAAGHRHGAQGHPVLPGRGSARRPPDPGGQRSELPGRHPTLPRCAPGEGLRRHLHRSARRESRRALVADPAPRRDRRAERRLAESLRC